MGGDMMPPDDTCMSTTSPLLTYTPPEQLEWFKINLVNAGGAQQLAFSIDSHEFWVVSADGEWVVPQRAQVRTFASLSGRLFTIF